MGRKLFRVYTCTGVTLLNLSTIVIGHSTGIFNTTLSWSRYSGEEATQ